MHIHVGGVKKYIVWLNSLERAYLERIIDTGHDAAGHARWSVWTRQASRL